METPPIRVPTHLSVKLPDDVAAILHRLAYETGRSKTELVIDAVRRAYAPREGAK